MFDLFYTMVEVGGKLRVYDSRINLLLTLHNMHDVMQRCSLSFDVSISRRSRDEFFKLLCLVLVSVLKRIVGSWYRSDSVSDTKSNVSVLFSLQAKYIVLRETLFY